jgi:predicted lipid-binding transport protein (Tim44 family)
MNGLSALLWTVAAIVLVLWLVGMVSANTFGGLIHVLLIIIIAAVVIEIFRPRRASRL